LTDFIAINPRFLIRGTVFLNYKESNRMTPTESIFKNQDNVKGFRLIPAVILFLLILGFFAVTLYVLVSAL